MKYKSFTLRAYTMRLAPPLGASKEDKALLWRKLWQTHDLVNRGTKVLGDVWLNLRGGLHASLATEAPSPDDARVLLALGWLTVEAPASAIPEHAILARADQDPKERSRALGARLESILGADGVPSDQVPAWMEACRATLAAEIREDAVWVDRRGEFERAAKTLGWTAREAREMLIDEMMDGIAAYLTVDDSAGKGEKKEYGKKAVNWISNNWGTGKKSDTIAILTKLKSVLNIPLENFINKSSQSFMVAIHEAVGAQGDRLADTNTLLEQIKKTFAWKGRPSAGCMALDKIAENPIVTGALTQRVNFAFNKEINDKEVKAGRATINWSGILKLQTEQATGLPFRTGKDNIWEYVVMLDHALRRVSIAHSWAKLAEASRRQFQEAATAPSDASVSAWVQRYALARAESSGSLGEYLIRRNALDGWKEVCQAWVNLGQEATAEKRIKAARDLQEEVDKFGDIQLFEALAEHPDLWSRDGAAKPELLTREVDRRIADNDRTRFKVPAYRHPDALLNPVFCDYGKSRWKIWYSAQDGEKAKVPRTITLDTCADGTISETEFRWQSKRLFNEIVSGAEETIEGSRNHRHGHAIHADKSAERIRTAGIFDLDVWNGRLQAPRASLERVHAMRARNAGQGQIDKAMARIPWLVTFSAPLIPEGPWLDFVQDDPTLQGHKPVKDLAPRGGYEFAGLSFPFIHPENGKTRKKAARIGLSRLKGLRILSADLGHRHAAACAVWRAIDIEELKSRCAAADSPAPAADALFLHLKEQGKTVVFRRLGADALPDGKAHPAPWAELERQFLIQLPGEESQARYATGEERNEVARLESLMGCRLPREPKGWRIDRLQLDLVRSARLGLRRHGTMARLAIGLGSTERIMPGGRRVPFSGREDKEAHLADLLLQQHRLLMDELFPDEAARDRWKGIAAGYLTEADLSGGESGPRRDTRGLAKRLTGLAAKFADGDPAAVEWITYWKERWQAMDGVWRDVIKGIRNILMPKGGKADKSIRRRGGLAMSRITAIEEFRRKVQLSYHNRQRLDGERAEAPEGFAAKALRSLEKLRENRVRQIASRLASAALGIGADPANKQSIFKRFPACHAVVIEDLSNYRPESTQTRRENRQLMQWSSGKVRKLLAEACQLAGLHLREISPAFTSRQDSRTGAPGLRCVEVEWKEFRRPGGYWARLVEKAREKDKTGTAGPLERYLIRLADSEGTAPTPTVLIPRRGAELFASSHDAGPIALQADLNAAANIGLVALMDPDWSGRWWFVPATRESHQPDKELKSAAPMASTAVLPVAAPADLGKQGRKRAKGKTDEMARHFRDPSAAPLGEGTWFVGFPDYEADYAGRVVRRLERRCLPLPETPF